jgi:hypothetical protein
MLASDTVHTAGGSRKILATARRLIFRTCNFFATSSASFLRPKSSFFSFVFIVR